MNDEPKPYVPQKGERVKIVLLMWDSEVELGPGYFVRIEPAPGEEQKDTPE